MTTLYTLDGDTKREMTEQEKQDYLNYQQQVEQQKQAELNAIAAQKAARQTVLDKLGLTADEAAALFG
jgi:hypothetical protein